MKKIVIVALVMMVNATAFAKDHRDIKVLSTLREVVYFKVNPSMIGASIEVYNENGDLVYSETVNSKKQIVDFFYEPSGTYTIYVTKDGKEEVIDYVKR